MTEISATGEGGGYLTRIQVMLGLARGRGVVTNNSFLVGPCRRGGGGPPPPACNYKSEDEIGGG